MSKAKPSATCDKCGGPYAGTRAAYEGRVCAKCLRKLRKGREAIPITFTAWHRKHREDRGHHVLPDVHHAKALEIERTPWAPALTAFEEK